MHSHHLGSHQGQQLWTTSTAITVSQQGQQLWTTSTAITVSQQGQQLWTTSTAMTVSYTAGIKDSIMWAC